LTMRGNTNFKGVILVLGQGELERNGGGNGDILGGITIAKFGRTSGNFLAPSFTTNGGGNSNIQYDSNSLTNALASATNVFLGPAGLAALEGAVAARPADAGPGQFWQIEGTAHLLGVHADSDAYAATLRQFLDKALAASPNSPAPSPGVTEIALQRE